MDYHQWYDRKDPSLCKIIQGVQFVAAMNPKAGSFTINPRLQRHFSVIGLCMPTDFELRTIYAQHFPVNFPKSNAKGQAEATRHHSTRSTGGPAGAMR